MQCRPARQASVTGFQQIQERHRRGRLNDGVRFSVVLRHFGNGGASGKAWGIAGRAGGVTWLGAGATGDAATPCARAGSMAAAMKHANMSLPPKARRLRRMGTVVSKTLDWDHAWGLPAPPIISMAVFSTAAVRFLRRFAFGRSR